MAREKKRRWLFLTFASFIFYGWWDWRFLFLILTSGLIDYFSALGMQKYPSRKKYLLIGSLIGNLGCLGIFKYLNFFTSNINALLLNIGLPELATHVQPTSLALPIGISFYTFQSLSYTIDVYRNYLRPTRNIFHFFSYLSMFPQLVAGPIVRAKDLLPQLEEWRKPSEQKQWDGMKLIAYGYFKKVVIADNLAPVVNLAFGLKYPILSAPYWYVIVSMFAFQIYFDFSGYSDIARGLAKTMGYEFNLNFNRPYRATSMRDFWKRWHISLSTWFRDYLYIPLGGSKNKEWRNQFNLWLTMLVAGLWHGAAWTFIVWGGLHAFYLHLERRTHWPDRLNKFTYGKYMGQIFVLFQVWIAWVFFRSETLDQAVQITSTMLSFDSWTLLPLLTGQLSPLFLLLGCFLWEFGLFEKIKITNWLSSKYLKWSDVIWVSIVLFCCVFVRGPGSAFIYFQF